MSKPLTYQRVLTSKRIALLLTLVMGFASGLLSAGYVGVKIRYELVPAEIIVAPPPPTATWCFPDAGFAEAEKFTKELVKQLPAARTTHYSDSLLNKAIKAAMQQDASGHAGYCQVRLLEVTPQHFAVVAMQQSETDPSRYTLITEQGYFYLHAIPKRRHVKYDSLVSARLGYQK